MELISQYEAAKRSGVTKQYISQMVKSQKLKLRQGKIDFDSEEFQDFMSCQAGSEENIKTISRHELEIKKLEAQTKKMEADTRLAIMRGSVMRGKLRDGRFMDMAFSELFSSAFEQFRGITSVLDSIIADAMNEGTTSRQKSEQRLYDRIDKIMDGLEKSWNKRRQQWNADIVKKRTVMDD